MANGRLGKAAVAPGGTSILYTNGSGAEASVSVTMFASSDTNIDLRLDTTSNAVTETLTVASETYDPTYLRYSVTNTGFTDSGAMAYVGRVQYRNVSAAQDLRVFEFYSNSGSTTYTVYNNSDAVTNTGQSRATYDVYTAEQIDTGGDIVIQDPNESNNVTVKAFPTPTTEDEYYKIIFNRTASASSTHSLTFTRGAGGIAIDPYPLTSAGGPAVGKKVHWVVGIGSGDMQAAFKYNGNAFESDTVGSSSHVYYRVTNGSSASTPPTTYKYAYLKPQRRVICIDPHGSSNEYVGFCTMTDTNWDHSSISNAAQRSINESYNAVYRITSGLVQRDGGIVLYFEYNPSDGKHYCALRNGTAAMLLTLTRDGILDIGAGQRVGGAFGTSDDYVTYDSNFSLTLNSFNMNDASLNFRSMRIGTSLWVLVVSDFDSNTTEEVFYSTDLISWSTPTTFYSPSDYSATSGFATIASNSGTVTATKTRIGVLGTDGVLEENLAMSQYERTGIVLSNGDRILVHNRGTTQTAVVQVMGYEGG